jgi:hypothetical protein
MVGWYASVLGLRPYLTALSKRAQTRAAIAEDAHGPWYWLQQLADGYSTSLDAVVPRGLVAFLITIAVFCQRPESRRLIGFVMIIMLAAMLENVLMCQHAVVYSFARVKGVAWVAAAIGIASSYSRIVGLTILPLSVSLAVALSATYSRLDLQPDRYQSFTYQRYHDLGRFIHMTCPDNGIPLTDDPVRGAEIYYSGRNLIELPRLGQHNEPAVQHQLIPFLEHYCHIHRVPTAICYQVQPAQERIVATRWDWKTKAFQQLIWWPRGGVDPPTWPRV